MLGAIIVAFSGFAIYLDRVEPIQLLLSPDGIIIAESGAANPFADKTLTELAGDDGNITTSDPRYRVLRTLTPDGFVAVTALSLERFDTAISRFRTTLAVGGGVILVLVAAILWVLTGILIRPVARMADVANRIADGDLETPVGRPSGTRETVDLAVDLDQMVSRRRGALVEANRSRDATERLLADMAHEIRTPLTALKGYSDLYAQGMLESSSDVDRAMSRIGSESERLSAFANAMLQLGQDGTSQPEIADFDIAALVEEVVADLRAAYSGQRIEFDIDRSRPLTVSGSRDRLQQAVLNLGSNACHHNPPGETIAITARLQTGAIRISVADNGQGVDPADRDRMETLDPLVVWDQSERDGMQHAGYEITDRYLVTALPPGVAIEGFRQTPAKVTRLIDEGEIIDMGTRQFEVLHLPGHSPGSIGLWEAATGTLFSGDAVYDGPLLDNGDDSDIGDYCTTMERLLELPVTVVHGGHDPSFGRDRLRQIARTYLQSRQHWPPT